MIFKNSGKTKDKGATSHVTDITTWLPIINSPFFLTNKIPILFRVAMLENFTSHPSLQLWIIAWPHFSQWDKQNLLVGTRRKSPLINGQLSQFTPLALCPSLSLWPWGQNFQDDGAQVPVAVKSASSSALLPPPDFLMCEETNSSLA